MKKLIFIVVIFFGCNKDSQKITAPENLISQEKMIDVIYEMTLINVSKGVNRSVLENNGVVPEIYIFNKYNIDSLQFALSNEFYSNDLDKYLEIYNRVKEKLQQNKQIALDSIGVYKKEKAKRSIEIAKERKNLRINDSIKMKRSRMPLKTNN